MSAWATDWSDGELANATLRRIMNVAHDSGGSHHPRRSRGVWKMRMRRDGGSSNDSGNSSSSGDGDGNGDGACTCLDENGGNNSIGNNLIGNNTGNESNNGTNGTDTNSSTITSRVCACDLPPLSCEVFRVRVRVTY